MCRKLGAGRVCFLVRLFFSKMTINKKITRKKFSWEMPIEDEILDFVCRMKRSMGKIVKKHSNRATGVGAKNYEDAYRTVEEYIRKQIELRKTLK